jgi:hypothetical protein
LWKSWRLLHRNWRGVAEGGEADVRLEDVVRIGECVRGSSNSLQSVVGVSGAGAERGVSGGWRERSEA